MNQLAAAHSRTEEEADRARQEAARANQETVRANQETARADQQTVRAEQQAARADLSDNKVRELEAKYTIVLQKLAAMEAAQRGAAPTNDPDI